MRILFIHNEYKQSRGGEDVVVVAETELLRSKGHEVESIYFNNANVARGSAGKFKAAASAVYNPSSAGIVKKAIASFKPDVVHVHNFFFAASPSVLIAAHECKVPVIVTLHNYRLICTNSLLLRNDHVCELCVNLNFAWYGVKYKCYHNSRLQSAAVASMAAIHKSRGTWKNSVDHYITPSYFSREKLIHSSLKVTPEKISVKRNFVPDNGYSSIESRKDYYLFVGRLSTEKGVQLLLEAWQNLPGLELIIAGDGPDGPMLKNKFGGMKNVQFVGSKPHEEVLNLMKGCRALIFPSIWYEGLPMTIVEAFSTGTPVIASELGSMKEMIQHKKNGVLFTTGDQGSLIKAVEDFDTSNVTLYENARKSYLEEYHPDKCYAAVMQLYNKVISSKT